MTYPDHFNVGQVVVMSKGPTFDVTCMDCGWSLLHAPSAGEASTVGQAHQSTHDHTDRHQAHGFVMVGRQK